MNRAFALGICALIALVGADVTAQRPADAVAVRAVAARSVVRPGDLLPVAVVLDHAPGFHSWPHVPVVPAAYRGVIPIPTTIELVDVPAGTHVGAIQWPEPEPVRVRYTRIPVDLLSFTGTTVAYVPLTLAPDQPPGDASLAVRVRYQACDERVCYPPETAEVVVRFGVAPAGASVRAAVNEPRLFADFRLAGAREALRVPAYLDVFGWSLRIDPYGAGTLALLFLLAALGGLLLNATPCVLPLIPIKVMGLRAVAGTPARLLVLGAAMAAGVVGFWLALGGAVAFVTGFDAISSLFQTGWFAPLVGAVVALAGVGMLGAFHVRLPQAVHLIDPSRETVPGSFAFGVLTAVLSTPCTAPFMAGAAAWAALQRPPVTLATFAAIGAGMALPYAVLSARPGLVRRIPRGGPGGVLVKQVMGLLLLAVAAYFVGSALSGVIRPPPAPPSGAYWWVVGGFVLAASGWFAYRAPRVARSVRARAAAATAAAVVGIAAVAVVPGLASDGPIAWAAYSPERFAAAARRGDVVVLDFTAEWCLNCKALEAGVLHRPQVVRLLEAPDVRPMRVDLTVENPAGRAKLKELGWVGIPLLAVFGPGTGYAAPIMYDSYTPGMVLEAVARARARPSARSASTRHENSSASDSLQPSLTNAIRP